MRFLWFAPAVMLGTLAFADALAEEDESLSPEQIARIQREEQRALEKVARAHGARLPSQMSPEERRTMLDEQRAASLSVYEQHHVSPKSYARRLATLSLEERRELAAATRALEQKALQERNAAAPDGGAVEPPAPKPDLKPSLDSSGPAPRRNHRRRRAVPPAN